MNIKKVAVLGSGVMGSAIAAHLANAGIPSYLLDIVPRELGDDDKKQGLTETDPRFRNKFAINAIQNVLPNQKPSPVFDKRVLKLITPGNFEDDMSKLAECDWIIEVVVERLDIKQKVFSQVEEHRRKDAVVSSNTSGIRLKEMCEGRSDSFKKHFLITHFFNPVRYMKLVEIVASEHTDPKIVSNMAQFLEVGLGKGVVYAKDTPTFVANRIGVYGFMNTIHHAIEQGMSIEAVDKITGPATGKAKSATFRTADLAGLDTLVHIAKNNREQIDDEGNDTLIMPDIITKMVENKWIGQKAGQGFYKKGKDASGNKQILSIDLKTGEYKEQEKVRYNSLGLAKNLDTAGERIKAMINADDEAGRFAWLTTRDTLSYAANRIPEITDDVVNMDRAMKWGFNWELGPFESLDAIGVKEFADRLQKDGKSVPNTIQSVLNDGDGVFYKNEGGKSLYFDFESKSYKAIEAPKTHLVLKTLRDEGKVLKSNSGASIIDLGDGVVNVEFHTKMNAIDADIGQILNDAIDLVEGDDQYKGIVISNDAQNFSVGANLMLLWMEAQQKNWDGIETMVKGFQDVCLRLRTSKKPVVGAPSGMALGGGCEVLLGCDVVRAHAETYIGLVEVGAGLIPGGGGNKNLLMNIEANLKEKGPVGWAGKSDGGPFPKAQKTFEAIGFAKVATSAVEGQKIGYLPGQGRTRLSMSRDHLLYDAKQDVLELAKDYTPAAAREDIYVAGMGGKMAMFSAIKGFHAQGLISDHDRLIAEKLAHVLAGGDLPNQGFVSEQYLLDIEREAFISLCGEEKTQARMQALLMTGKPLRN
ncbi:MAG: 3-hydroxyacyl-CoA dehydrogenase/enoyl-CoA hydratase family protein [Deltaproteobacteria bacterium]|nr:3-hydroxyacyl-CoA dehydrogenase/enoyl-CoA hydratase family protein [Deltaproteobacteria bacterium]